uniref:thiopurine S-methyltransferase n=1 Tax=Neogobius melanostomus TaxID=47308 RepID=A0A8C6T8E6_9GOBI
SMSAENQAGTLEEWEEHWQHGGFYVMLAININKVIAGRAAVKFFVSLFGKTADMKWLGHSVVGVERSENAVRQFFVESNMSYTEESVPAIFQGVFSNPEKTVTLYQCDIYSFSSSLEGQFDAMWDRGALVVIDPKHRQKYVSLIISLMAPGCRCLLDTMLYDPERYAGMVYYIRSMGLNH